MKTLFLLLAVLIATSLCAQVELLTSFNSTYSGRNVALTISKTNNNRHEVGVGIRYNIGMLAMPDDQENIFYKRLFPSTFGQHWGAQAFYHYHVFNHWAHVNPFLFYDVQAAYSTTRNRFYNAGYIERLGPFTWIEQNIGIGFKADLPGQFFISQKIGVGGGLVLGNEEKLLKTSASWEFGGLINVGIGYRFK